MDSKRTYNATARQVGKTPLRAIRIPENIWLAAKLKADADGVTVSEIIRLALTNYANPDHQQ